MVGATVGRGAGSGSGVHPANPAPAAEAVSTRNVRLSTPGILAPQEDAIAQDHR